MPQESKGVNPQFSVQNPVKKDIAAELLHLRHGTLHGAVVVRPTKDAKSADYLNSAAYGGVWFPRFGHFLLETLARFEPESWTNQPIVFHVPSRSDDSKPVQIYPWQADVLALLGVSPKNLHFVRRDFFVSSLTISPRGSAIPCSFSTSWKNNLQSRLSLENAKKNEAPGKYWFQRHSFPTVRPWHLPASVQFEIEEELIDLGWSVVAPETLGLSPLLEIMNTGDIVAGIPASWHHALILTGQRHTKGQLVLVSNNPVPRTYQCLADFMNRRQSILSVEQFSNLFLETN